MGFPGVASSPIETLKSGLTNLAISTSLGSSEQYKRLYGVDKYEIVLNEEI